MMHRCETWLPARQAGLGSGRVDDGVTNFKSGVPAGQAGKGRKLDRAVPVVEFMEQKTPHKKYRFPQTCYLSRTTEAASGDYSYFTQVWWARHLLSPSSSALQSPSFLQRSADHIDYTVSELERDPSDGTLDALGCFLPRELKQLGHNGGFLRG